MVAIRPTTYTYKLIEETDEFTVNVPHTDMKEIVTYCGTASGWNTKKFQEKKIPIEHGITVQTPIISNCIAHYECRVILKTKVTPNLIMQEIQNTHFQTRNYHTLYFGKILATLTEGKRLKE